MKKCFYIYVVVLALARASDAAVLEVRLEDPPAQGMLICLLYDSANTFGDLRDAYRTERFPITVDNRYLLTGIPSGSYALVAFLDDNGNGYLDKNFIGIPREPVGFSNGYQPKGPPSYQRAEFGLRADETRIEAITLTRVLGKRGRIGVGLGVIGRSTPYRDYSGGVYQPIPAVTYVGERLQVRGPSLSLGLMGSGKTRLATILTYRIGVYEEDDSPFLQGMGDRRNTVMLGLALQAELPGGLNTSLDYQHDVLDEIGGGSGRVTLGKSYQWGVTRLTPNVGINWLSDTLTNYDYGVTPAQARAARPAYAPGESWSPEIGLGALVEITRDWLIVGSLGAEFLDGNVRTSPIVSEDYVLKGFLAINFLF